MIKSKLIFIFIFFGVIFSILSIIPHFNYNTNAWDLGIFNQTLYHYSQLEIKTNTIRHVPTLLADHAGLILFLFAPLYYLFGTYTLLIIQIFFVLFGGLGVYLLIKQITKDSSISIYALIALFLHYGIYSAITFDYHNIVIGAALLPWLFLTLYNKKFLHYFLVFLLILSTKENTAIFLAFISLALVIFKKEKSFKLFGILGFVLSTITYVFLVYYLLPSFNNGTYHHFNYYDLPINNPVEFVKYVFNNPLNFVSLFFNDSQKLMSWAYVLLSGGIFAFLNPIFAVSTIPLFLQKFLSNQTYYWGTSVHTSIEFSFLIIPFAFIVISQKFNSHKLIFSKLLLIINFILLFNLTFYDSSNIFRLFSKSYYFNKDRKEITKILKTIPTNASISATNTLVPHLANRDNIFLFPLINNSEYVVIYRNNTNFWPINSKEELLQKEQDLLNQNYKLQKTSTSNISIYLQN